MKNILTTLVLLGFVLLESCHKCPDLVLPSELTITCKKDTTKSDSTPVTTSNKNFIRRKGSDLVVGTNDNIIMLNGLNFSNNTYFDAQSQNPYRWHHGEEAFQQLKDLGANSIRFAFTYTAFEKESAYNYNADMWAWIDQNIAWGKKYGIYIILDFHYQLGGFGDNWTIWTDNEAQNRFVALWKAIAQKYKDEPQIAGYDLINEPHTKGGDAAWRLLAQTTIDAIRSVDKNHLIIVPRIEATDINNSHTYSTENYYKLNEENLMYTFHFYKPQDFTHQNLSWSGSSDGGFYPNPNVYEFPTDLLYGTNSLLVSPELPIGTSAWKYYEGQKIKVTDASLTVGLPQLGVSMSQGKVYFDEILIKEYDENGNYVKDVVKLEITNKNGWSWYSPSSSDISTVVADGVNDGANPSCVAISAVPNFAVFTNWGAKFPVKTGYSYSVSGWLRGENISSDAHVRLQVEIEKSASGRKPLPRTKEYLEDEMKRFVRFVQAGNYPVLMGEFAALDWSSGKGALDWTNDVLDLAKKYKVHTSYFEYYSHEKDYDHALYQTTDKKPNQGLINLLKSKFR